MSAASHPTSLALQDCNARCTHDQLVRIYSATLECPVVSAPQLTALLGAEQRPEPDVFVYFARTTCDVKIGFSYAPLDRVQSLGLLPVLLVTEAGRDIESFLHRRFMAERTRRAEYFAGSQIERLIDDASASACRRVSDLRIGNRLRSRLDRLNGVPRRSAIGSIVKEARLSLGLNQRQLSALAGLSNAYVCQLENDWPGARIVQPSLAKLAQLARALGLQLSSLIEAA